MGDGYTFCIRQGIRQVSGTLNISGPATIQAAASVLRQLVQ